MQVYSVDKLMSEARRLAVEYRRATGRPLAISGELAKHDAIRLLGLKPAPLEAMGYDALGQGPDEGVRYQVKGRAIFDERKGGQRLGQIKTGQTWDRILLVLMDAEFFPVEIYEAERGAIVEAYEQSTGSRRSKRGALSVARFKNLGRLVWSGEGACDGDEPNGASAHARGG